jgi:GTPase
VSRARISKAEQKQRHQGDTEGGAPRDSMRAIVLHPVLRGETNGSDPLTAHKLLSPDAYLEEAVGLARAIQLDVCHSELVPISHIRPATLMGKGKAEEYHALAEVEGVGLIIVDYPLTPIQQRNLEKVWNTKVLDRTGLILEIFGARARTKEGRLQVELAHLLYQRSRLVRSWTHLERQRGGFGFLGGPGETQIEADRRVIGERIDAIRRELEAVRRTRELHRESRRRVPFPAVALAGYTNAGKSSLFNVLTEASVVAEDKLFATLDPTMRRIHLPGGHKAILSDTVGFISDLPTMLVAAFRATLEEVSQADLILHVRDIALPNTEQQKEDVEKVLAQLDIETGQDAEKIVEVWNKIDLLDETQRGLLNARLATAEHCPVMVSTYTGEGISELKEQIDTLLSAKHVERTFNIPSDQGALIAWLYEHAQVRSRSDQDNGMIELEVRIAKAALGRFEHLLFERK